MNEPTGATHPPRRLRLTLETVLWVAVATIGVAVRVVNLDAAPLSALEARQALLSLRAVSGEGMPNGPYSPLLFVVNSLSFALAGPSDACARAWSVLFGSLLVVTPLLVRRTAGRLGSLAAGFYLAVSPTAIVASRQVDGTVIAVLGTAIAFGALLRYCETEQHRWVAIAAGAVALAVVSSPAFYTTLLPLALAGGWGALSAASGAARERLNAFRPHWQWAVGVLLCASWALATGLGWHPSGVGAAGDLLVDWIARFRPAPAPATSPLVLVAAYEPLALLFGLGGLLWAVLRGRRFGIAMGLWAGLGAVLLTLMPGRRPLDTLAIVLPLAVLTGTLLDAAGRHLVATEGWRKAWPYLPILLALWVYFYLMLSHHAATGNDADLLLAFLAVGLQLLLASLFAMATRTDIALHALAAGAGLALLVATVSTGWGVAHVRPSDPRELLLGQTTAIEVRDLVATLGDLSWRETGIGTTLEYVLETEPDSVLAWYMRDFRSGRMVEALQQEALEEPRPVLVTERRDLDLHEAAYVGQDFVLRRTWDVGTIACPSVWPPRCQDAVRWLLFRGTAAMPEMDEWAVVWLPDQDAGQNAGLP